MGNGKSDSFLDKILFSSSACLPEKLETIECSLLNPLINSHHDLLISSFVIPDEAPEASTDENVVAPLIDNNRVKVIWSEDGIERYQSLVVPQLSRLRELWLSSPSKSSTSLLLQSTNNVLNTCASLTNRTVPLDQKAGTRSTTKHQSLLSSLRKLF